MVVAKDGIKPPPPASSRVMALDSVADHQRHFTPLLVPIKGLILRPAA